MARSRWVRLAIRVGVAVALGVATSVGVAWALALLPMPTEPMPRRMFAIEPAAGGWTYVTTGEVLRASGVEWCRLSRSHETIEYERAARRQAGDRGTEVPASMEEEVTRWKAGIGTGMEVFASAAFGWPEPAMSYHVKAPPTAPGMRLPVRSGIVVREPRSGPSASTRWQDYGTVIPLAPVWRGLVVNTLWYTAMWAAALLGVSVGRRWRRRHAGLCELCGYELKGVPAGAACPECGRGR